MKKVQESLIVISKEILSEVLTIDAQTRGVIPPSYHLLVTHIDSFENDLEIEVDVYQETIH